MIGGDATFAILISYWLRLGSRRLRVRIIATMAISTAELYSM